MCEQAFSETRAFAEGDEVAHCCFRRTHTQCLDGLATSYSRDDMASTCGKCSGAIPTDVFDRVHRYDRTCIQNASLGLFEVGNWPIVSNMDLSTLASDPSSARERTERR